MAKPDVERRHPGRRMLRREDGQRRRGAAIPLRLTQLVAHLAPRLAPVLRLDDNAQLSAAAPLRVDGEQEVALLGADDVARGRAGSLERICGPTDDLPEHLLEQVLEVGTLGRRFRPLRGARGRCRLDGREPVVELLERGVHLCSELV